MLANNRGPFVKIQCQTVIERSRPWHAVPAQRMRLAPEFLEASKLPGNGHSGARMDIVCGGKPSMLLVTILVSTNWKVGKVAARLLQTRNSLKVQEK